MRKTKRMRIVEYWEEVNNGCFVLKKSTKPGARGAIKIEKSSEVIDITTYATFNSPIHNLTASPGERIFNYEDSWFYSGESNGIGLEADSLKRLFHQDNKYVVNTIYRIPENYSGPHYSERVICFDKESLKIIWVKMRYEDGRSDLGKFTYTKKGFKIRWQCEYGPNKHNISFF
ncbi:MAG: hypothetical protein NTX00_05730 [Candidatus Parcubacteria bacterium]|nr:hypothetical protein [Candidatus Parcubacteria bacterium]